MTKVKELLGKSGGKAFPGTQVKFRQSKGGPKISSVKTPKFHVGAKLNLK
jgi:hypothetical protein